MKRFIPFAILGILAACSSESPSQNVPGDAGNDAKSTFDCYGKECNPASQYCILSKQGSIVLAAMCAPLPQSCGECSCASSDAPKRWAAQNPGTNNCSGTIFCSGGSDGIIVTCSK